ncbi:hypothetical protein PsorP6_012165 [Peronosclerospora sorghi]|uniref:Uncharacterized protein n=1 Tax=Peronosclerospora sorghi TaxID=230839 RepID=A0ACC0WME8_9STRA|nr:hypothetical protein PsorP6_012165 [Peronosclerospora sorghi]
MNARHFHKITHFDVEMPFPKKGRAALLGSSPAVAGHQHTLPNLWRKWKKKWKSWLSRKRNDRNEERGGQERGDGREGDTLEGEEEVGDEDPRDHLNVVLIGHVEAEEKIVCKVSNHYTTKNKNTVSIPYHAEHNKGKKKWEGYFPTDQRWIQESISHLSAPHERFEAVAQENAGSNGMKSVTLEGSSTKSVLHDDVVETSSSQKIYNLHSRRSRCSRYVRLKSLSSKTFRKRQFKVNEFLEDEVLKRGCFDALLEDPTYVSMGGYLASAANIVSLKNFKNGIVKARNQKKNSLPES